MSTKTKPVDHVRESTVEVSIWGNEGKSGTYYKATVENSYLAGENPETGKGLWKSTDSYSEDELTALATAALNARAKMRKLRLAQSKDRNPTGEEEAA